MICTAMIPTSVDQAVAALKGLALAEMRMEKMVLTQKDVERIFDCNAKIVATCRPDGIADVERGQILSWAIGAGAAYVDLEVEAGDGFKKPLIEQAKAAGCQVIISYHNFESTPGKAELSQIVEDCFAEGADIAKLATQVNTVQDAARILGLLDDQRTVLPIGMGELGAITRVAGPLLGAPFSFAPLQVGAETAPGQLDRPSLENMYKLLNGS